MRDEMDGRLWVEHHEQFSESLHEAFTAIGAALRKLHDIEWSAPWRRAGSERAGKWGAPQA